MLRTLSARILLSFAALTVTFGVITGTVVFNLSQVEDQNTLIAEGYAKLLPAANLLNQRQDDLSDALNKKDQGRLFRSSIKLARQRRNAALKDLRTIVENAKDVIQPFAPTDYKNTKDTLAEFEKEATASEEEYERFDQLAQARNTQTRTEIPPSEPGAAEPISPATPDPLAEVQKKLFEQEHRTKQKTDGLLSRLGRRVNLTTEALRQNLHTVRMITIYLGVGALAIGLAIAVMVVITLRPLRRLRDGAKRIAAGDYESRIPERGPAEVSDLAREFNAMGRAVMEREHQLVTAERLTALGNMARLITHEVRNPLSSIGLNTELLTELLDDELRDLPDAEEARTLCASIHREIDRLTAITEEYLAFGRLPKPKLAGESINDLVAALASFVREDLAIKQIAMVTDLAPDDPTGVIDSGQIRQCLINLVRNAAEALASKASGTITLRTRREGDRVAIEVEDDGVGIEAELLPRLFDTSFSTKAGGSGIGLALTLQIVRDHGGNIDVASVVGRGTTFTVRVPRSGLATTRAPG